MARLLLALVRQSGTCHRRQATNFGAPDSLWALTDNVTLQDGPRDQEF